LKSEQLLAPKVAQLWLGKTQVNVQVQNWIQVVAWVLFFLFLKSELSTPKVVHLWWEKTQISV
jgi:hypothetical protein